MFFPRFPHLMVVFTLMIAMPAQAQPVVLHEGISVESTAWPVDAVRIAYNPVAGELLLASLNGDILRVDPDPSDQRTSVLYRSSDHGVPSPLMGMDIGADGTIYLVGNDAGTNPGFNVGVIRRGTPDGNGGHLWQTVATTDPYPRSATPFDHNMNGIVLSPDGSELYINSGSRTDHGEVQENNGQFPGIREVPLTSAILRIPVDAMDLVLQNDASFLEQQGYLFADGTRNSFSLAFDGQGRLFGTENSGDRDDEEELNLIEEGKHYGFPWRMGLTDTPMQFDSYDPAADLLLNPESYAVQNGYFYNDPAYPAPPDGIVFTDPVRNVGPDANLYRDPATGTILDANDTGRPMGTFTSHRSPLGLVFDASGDLPAPFTSDALVLSWTGPESDLMSPYPGEGEDLLHLVLSEDDQGPVIEARQIVTGFQNPIDAELVDGTLYVLEYGSDARVWRISFGSDTATEDSTLPSDLRVELWPNPAGVQRRARITAASAGRVSAELVAVDGRMVNKVMDRFMTSGESIQISVDTPRLPAGVYFLVVTSEREREVLPVVVR
jgi:glucose/arabinose dehydrogenase